MSRRKDKLPPICETWREEARRRPEAPQELFTRTGSRGPFGISFQEPKGWTDGKGGIKYVPSGPHKGRVMWTSRREAQELAKRMSDAKGRSVEYDP